VGSVNILATLLPASSAARTLTLSMKTPTAYKSIDAAMDAHRALVDAVHTLRPVVCTKG